MIGEPWRTLLVAALLVGAGFGAGWTVNGWRLGAALAEAKQQHADTIAAVNAASVAALQVANDEADRLRKTITAADLRRLTEAKANAIKDAELRAAVVAGVSRLHVRANCPAAATVSATASPAGVAAAAGSAELAADARQDYFTIRSGIAQLEQDLSACKLIAIAMAGGR